MNEELVIIPLSEVRYNEYFFSFQKVKYWKRGRAHNMTEVVDQSGKPWAWPAYAKVFIPKSRYELTI